MSRLGACSGAYNDDNDPYMMKLDACASLYYEEVRNRDTHTEVSAVLASSGVDLEDARKAHDHLFVNEYDLGDRLSRLAPMYEIAES